MPGWRKKVRKVRLVGPVELTVVVGETEFKLFGASVGEGRAPFDEDCLFVELVDPNKKGKILVHRVQNESDAPAIGLIAAKRK